MTGERLAGVGGRGIKTRAGTPVLTPRDLR